MDYIGKIIYMVNMVKNVATMNDFFNYYCLTIISMLEIVN
ncbi:hypothetical protein CAXC1_180014 [Candidatus Xenohaliotis californiensis]|uniref:Uncharacterized protein n=1 Tax=Candidatus Xenohaliotis californiensis TaxID=84677 RepID=A0ABP0EUB7_9RICK|nr:hypothetical protein CAXC1_180014 [Candidatus Xenohaliotis californiensis]